MVSENPDCVAMTAVELTTGIALLAGLGKLIHVAYQILTATRSADKSVLQVTLETQRDVSKLTTLVEDWIERTQALEVDTAQIKEKVVVLQTKQEQCLLKQTGGGRRR